MDDADGRGFAIVGPVLAGVAEVEVHLADVSVGVGAEFQIDDDEAAQAAVEEDEVHAIPCAADAQAALASDEGEIAAKFEQEGFEVAHEGVFEVGLGVFVVEVEEFDPVAGGEFFRRCVKNRGFGFAQRCRANRKRFSRHYGENGLVRRFGRRRLPNVERD